MTWWSRIAFAFLFGAFAVPAAAQTTTDPLRLVFECRQGSELTFRFTVQNVGAAPTAMVIGTILANDKKYLPQTLELVVRRVGSPDTILTYINQSPIGGRIDPWLIPLPPDAAYSVGVPARNFKLGPRMTEEPFVVPADLQLRLATREIGGLNLDVQGLKFINVWAGTLTSEWLQFPNRCSRTP